MKACPQQMMDISSRAKDELARGCLHRERTSVCADRDEVAGLIKEVMLS